MSGERVEWQPPGPGRWELDSSHCPPAPTPFFRRIASASAESAYEWVFETYGGPLRTISMRFVNGKMYRRLVPLVGADSDRRPPPAPVLWVAARVHPTFRRRNRIARRTLAEDTFLEPIAAWETSERSDWIGRNLALQHEELGAMSADELADHVARVADHVLAGWTRHHQLHGTDVGPLGDLLAHAQRWGLDATDTMLALRGASPATTEVRTLARAIADAVSAAGRDPSTLVGLADIRAAGPDAQARLDDFLDLFGCRVVTSYDIEGATVGELPGSVAAMVRAASGPPPEDGEAARAARAAQLREAVPPADRPVFDRLLANARRAYGLRDDNGPITAEWPMGLARRAWLEAGRRLAAGGRLERPEHSFEVDAGELARILRGAADPSAADVARMADRRAAEADLKGPAVLGPDHPAPDPGILPDGLRRMTELVTTAVGLLERNPDEATPLVGLGIGERAYVGRARVASGPVDVLQTMEPGDVLVAAWTAPTYNSVLAIAGAVVVQEGGPLSHAAVMARELGIPAVIGAAGALDLIGEGDTVEVDPVAGTVRILGRVA